ncbi:MAG: SsrA-binding protein SmpB [Planctomycetota bacterium]
MSKSAEFVAKNKKAFFDYEILEKIEAGISLTGTEVKSLRQGKVALKDSFARFRDGELYLLNVHISKYEPAHKSNHDPERQRKLLLHRRQLDKLEAKLTEKGLTVVPLSLYFNRRGIVKLELGICRGKRLFDKRESIKKRETERDITRQMSKYKR